MSDAPDDDRRRATDRRQRPERRSGAERRVSGEVARVPPTGDRRAPADRRRAPRRSGAERRLALPLAGQLRLVIDLLFQVHPGSLSDDDRRRFDTAIFRLRYALESLEDEQAHR
jgi:hypothetical protein